ncbi:hypothetical protein AVEN_251344-1 [Araneus ventricosus]|uniref:Uncharacterized protein n=1 Tax=Araneus ventricosus TaxID=182803 RepID=A0A4Y2KE32_ARAVE|nr:hypothetical protein AVEN_251344-1 [Araneus ventricosus]
MDTRKELEQRAFKRIRNTGQQHETAQKEESFDKHIYRLYDRLWVPSEQLGRSSAGRFCHCAVIAEAPPPPTMTDVSDFGLWPKLTWKIFTFFSFLNIAFIYRCREG